MSIESIEQVGMVLGMIGSVGGSLWRFSKRIGAMEGKIDALLLILDAFPAVSEAVQVQKTRQTYLENKIKALERYN